jgi:hypothetical protein
MFARTRGNTGGIPAGRSETRMKIGEGRNEGGASEESAPSKCDNVGGASVRGRKGAGREGARWVWKRWVWKRVGGGFANVRKININNKILLNRRQKVP